MIRKVLIVVLTLASAGSGTLGTVAGLGCFPGARGMEFGRPEDTGYSFITIVWGATRIIKVLHVKYLDNPPSAPGGKQWMGTGWGYRTSIQIDPSGRSTQARFLIVSFLFPVVLSALFAIYPTIAFIHFIRGPLRRSRRRRKGLCVKCGYDLTGNVTGVCPECGLKVKQL